MNTAWEQPTIETCLPNTRQLPNGQFEGYVRSRLSDGQIRELSVCHMHTATVDEFGNNGTVRQFTNDADAINAALALSKLVIAGEVEPGRLIPNAH